MPVVLRLERPPPARIAVLEAAAEAALTVCAVRDAGFTEVAPGTITCPVR